MALSYEDALETLHSMFADSQWTRDTLDAVLRHQKGHMENTVDFILRHTGKDPQTLVDQLAAGVNPDDTSAMDAELARQLAAGPSAVASSTTAPRRGTPVTLPDDFLRIPGFTSTSQMDSDEALARMLQNEMFTDEMRNDPDLGHLAGRNRNRRSTTDTNTAATNRNASTARSNPFPGLSSPPNIMKHLTDLGDNARKRLQLMAAQFNARNNPNHPHHPSNSQDHHIHESRGLLDGDDNDDEPESMELAGRTPM